MRSAPWSRSALLAFLFLVVVGPSTSRVAATDPAGPPTLAGCPTNADALCKFYDGPTAVPTAYCLYEDCFEMSYGEEVRVVAADEQGAFPKTWFVWHDGEVQSDAGMTSCFVTEQKNKLDRRHKTRLDIPPDPIVKCKASLQIDDRLYTEHVVSNPATGCVGWLECKRQ